MAFNRKIAMMIFVNLSLLIILLISGCSASNSSNNHYAYTTTKNFYRDEYDPQYRQYDKIIPVDKTTSPTIDIEGTVSSGTILVQIFDPEDQEVQTLSLDKPTRESVPVNEKYGEWRVRISIDENTEGSITIAN